MMRFAAVRYLVQVDFNAGVVNRGTIEIDNRGDPAFGSEVVVNVTSGTLVNEPGGLIDVLDGAGANRRITGRLENQGTIRVRKDFRLISELFTSTSGTIACSPGIRLDIGGNSQAKAVFGSGTVLTGSATLGFGTVDLASDFTLPAGFTLSAAWVTGPGRLINRGALFIGSGTGTGVTVSVVNHGLLRIEGGAGFGPVTNEAGATIRVTAVGPFRAQADFTGDLVNRGTIEIDDPSLDNEVVVNVNSGTLVNEPGGLIDVLDGAGANRRITGRLENRGTIRVRKDFRLISELFTNTSGTIQVAPGQTMTVDGNFGAIIVGSGTSLTGSGTVVLSGPMVTLNDDLVVPAGATLRFAGWVQGVGRIFNEGTLIFNGTMVLNEIVNRGLLTATGANRLATFLGSITNDVNATIRLALSLSDGASANASFSRGLANGGLLEIGSGVTANISGGFACAASSIISVGVSGADANQFGALSVSDAATLAGTLRVRLVAGYKPTAGQSIQLMSFLSSTGGLSLVDDDPSDGVAFVLSQNATDLRITVATPG